MCKHCTNHITLFCIMFEHVWFRSHSGVYGLFAQFLNVFEHVWLRSILFAQWCANILEDVCTVFERVWSCLITFDSVRTVFAQLKSMSPPPLCKHCANTVQTDYRHMQVFAHHNQTCSNVFKHVCTTLHVFVQCLHRSFQTCANSVPTVCRQ